MYKLLLSILTYSGPILSSYLYELGGFALPLDFTGGLILSFTFCLSIIIPSRNDKEEDIKAETKALTVWEVMKVR